MTSLPVQRAHELALRPPEHRWLIEDLWEDQAVGVVGGEPKCCKSFLALALAVAVASGAPCLRRFPVVRTGRVLLYPAEDALAAVRERLDGICRATGVQLARLDIQVITSPELRLDTHADRERLRETVSKLRPTLLVLDPFVRLHRGLDENSASEVAPLLAYLRELQRHYQTAIAVVHHARKRGGRERPGQALRGSSEFHSWGESNLYLRRNGDELFLSIEHRNAASSSGLRLRLVGEGQSLGLVVLDSSSPPPVAPPQLPAERILAALETLEAPITMARLRQLCRMRTATLCDALADLVQEGRVTHTDAGYLLAIT